MIFEEYDRKKEYGKKGKKGKGNQLKTIRERILEENKGKLE